MICINGERFAEQTLERAAPTCYASLLRFPLLAWTAGWRLPAGGLAYFNLDILALAVAEDRHAVAIASPTLWHRKRGIYREFIKRWTRDINLDREIRRRVNSQIDSFLASDTGCVLNVEACIGP
jgi:hypothetical protein